MSLRVTVSSKDNSLSEETVAKASLNRAIKLVVASERGIAQTNIVTAILGL